MRSSEMRARDRRFLLIAFALVLLLIDGALLLRQARREPSVALTVALQPIEIVVPHDDPMPALGAHDWQLNGRTIPDIRSHAATAARESGNMTRSGPLVFVSLGPNPSLGQFLRSMQSLRVAGLCHVLVLEGGRDYGLSAFFDRAEPRQAVGLPILSQCGRSIH